MSLKFQYEISETPEVIVLDVELPASVTAKELDITLTDQYISIIACNYYLVLDFNFPVKYQQSVCKVKKAELHCEIPKEYRGDWDQILYQNENDDNSAVQARRDEAFKRLQLENAEEQKEKDESQAKHAREAEDKQLGLRELEREKMRELKEQEIQSVKDQIEELQSLNTGNVNEVLPAPRTTATTQIKANFTKRKYAVPARDNRDIYLDEFEGKMIPEIEKQAPEIELKQAVNYMKRPTPEYEEALNICAGVIKQSPDYLKAVLLMSEIYLEQSRFDDSLLLTRECIRMLKMGQYSREMQSKVNAMHAVSLCGSGKQREALRYMETAFQLNKQNEQLGRDLQMVRRIVSYLDGLS